ncbi:Arabinose operon regulatory protein [Moraxella caprae]|uniref:Arabinose operon regulatory protein n=1 Tax=Moraxella caprae TaxID=90240 RepID=A0A378QZ70_9GAMM|nr:AraC family transcriptional regulator [Moraxella caprae]STZ08343.1 Arabinose operon regulatory protein [Moraxella caprae]
MDALTHLFTQFSFRTELFFVGLLCRMGQFDEPNKGYLHFIYQGSCRLIQKGQPPMVIDRPCVLFSPAGCLHRVEPTSDDLQVFCVSFDFGQDIQNPLIYDLTQIAILFLDDMPHLMTVAQQIFKESQSPKCGHQALISYLCGYVLILVVRECLEKGLIKVGLLRGLTDTALAPLLLDIHQNPVHAWDLQTMADKVFMSKAKFGNYFKEVMGVSPSDYLTTWRISLAQMLLKKGLPVAVVAQRVGYSHNASLTRAFVKEIGKTPSEWLGENFDKKW